MSYKIIFDKLIQNVYCTLHRTLTSIKKSIENYNEFMRANQ